MRTEDPEWQRYVRDLGLRVQRLRDQRMTTQDEVAARAGISRVTFQRLEHGQGPGGITANPNLYTLVAVAEVLGVAVSDLLPPEPPDVTVR
jgi:transcriptional regulator with XRE-family HTH domain